MFFFFKPFNFFCLKFENRSPFRRPSGDSTTSEKRRPPVPQRCASVERSNGMMTLPTAARCASVERPPLPPGTKGQTKFNNVTNGLSPTHYAVPKKFDARMTLVPDFHSEKHDMGNLVSRQNILFIRTQKNFQLYHNQFI